MRAAHRGKFVIAGSVAFARRPAHTNEQTPHRAEGAGSGSVGKSDNQIMWCGREDSNFHEVSPTATSTLRVYQFRHDRNLTNRRYRTGTVGERGR